MNERALLPPSCCALRAALTRIEGKGPSSSFLLCKAALTRIELKGPSSSSCCALRAALSKTKGVCGAFSWVRWLIYTHWRPAWGADVVRADVQMCSCADEIDLATADASSNVCLVFLAPHVPQARRLPGRRRQGQGRPARHQASQRAAGRLAEDALRGSLPRGLRKDEQTG